MFLKKIFYKIFLAILTKVIPDNYFGSISQPGHGNSSRHPKSKGFLVSVTELIDIREKANNNIEPYKTNVAVFIHLSDSGGKDFA